MFGLRRAGHQVTLLAPGPSGAALVGPGPGEAQALLAFEDKDVATLFGEAVAPRLRERLGAFDLAVAYTRSVELAESLSRAVARVVSQDPSPPDGAGHVSRWLLQPLTALGIPVAGDDPPVLQPTAEEDAAAAVLRGALPARFLAVHPGSGSARKRWPADRFLRLVDGLPAGPFLLVVGPADAEAATPLRDHPGAVIADGLPVRALGALVRQAAAFVGNDSGVTHLAAAAGAPSVALFGPTDPGVWAPVGPRVRVVRAAGGRMEDLEVEVVREAVLPLLNGASVRGAT